MPISARNVQTVYRADVRLYASLIRQFVHTHYVSGVTYLNQPDLIFNLTLR
jgi:hypothetical protein